MQRSSSLGWAVAVVLVCLLAGVGTAWGQWNNGAPGGGGETEPPVSVSAEWTPATAQTPAKLWITARMQPGWHIYSITQPPKGPMASKITVAPSTAYRLAGEFRAVPEPEKKPAPEYNGLIVESHHEKVVWEAPLELTSDISAKQLRIEGSVRVQPCNANGCMMPVTLPFIAAQGHAVGAPAKAQASTETANVPAAAPAAAPVSAPPSQGSQLEISSLPMALALGFLGGLILNLMPCVLPVIGLKLFSFIEQSGNSRGRAFALNVWYSLGLLAVFMVLASLATFLGLGWGRQFTSSGFNIVLTCVVFAMGLSFLGVWEVPIPGFAGRGAAGALAEREGASGAFAKGMLTTLLATPCSAPFLAPALTWSASQPPSIVYTVFLSMGLGMASPYLVIGAFPQLVGFLPKPGAWMDTFKQLMGFVLMGTVVFLMTFMYAPYVVPTVGLLFGIWLGCWWIGRTPYTADFGPKMRAWLSATAIVGVTVIVTFGWLAGIMENRYSANEPFSRAKVERLVASGNTVMVDFTADWCLTCKSLEALYLDTDAVHDMVRANRVVMLTADWTHGDPEVTEMLESLGSQQVPVIAVFPAGKMDSPIVLIGGYTQQSVLDALKRAGPSRQAAGSEENLARAG